MKGISMRGISVNKRHWFIGGSVATALMAVGLGMAARFTPAGRYLSQAPPVGAAYTAQLMCAGVFVMGREPKRVFEEDILPVNPLLRHADVAVDREGATVTASLFGMGRRSALYRPGVGCTLIGAGGREALLRQADGLSPMRMEPRAGLWPEGDQIAPAAGASGARLAKVLADVFADPPGVSTRAVLLVKDGRILAERYGPGYGPDTRMLGWSMSKSVTSALVGLLVADGRLALDAPAPVSAWAGDGRRAITLRHLLTMTDGLKFQETYQPTDDSTAMLFRHDDMGGYAQERPLLHAPGTVWSYSSGTTNILSRIIFSETGGTLAAGHDFVRDRLFLPAGMTSAIFEPDATGSFVGASYLYMTARDWARFGQLYLGEGEISGRRILPRQWVADSRRPLKTADGRPERYGMQFWLNGDGAGEAPLRLPHCPADLYMARGHNGQVVAIVPSAGVVFVRLGWDTGTEEFDIDRHLSAALQVLRT